MDGIELAVDEAFKNLNSYEAVKDDQGFKDSPVGQAVQEIFDNNYYFRIAHGIFEEDPDKDTVKNILLNDGLKSNLFFVCGSLVTACFILAISILLFINILCPIC